MNKLISVSNGSTMRESQADLGEETCIAWVWNGKFHILWELFWESRDRVFFIVAVVVLPVLVDFGGFVGAIFSCFLTSEVRTILGWLSLTRPVIFNTKMKTERSCKSWHENSKLLTQIIGAHPVLGIISSTLTKKKEREVRMEGAQKAPRFRI